MEGTDVNFECPDDESWRINSVEVIEDIPDVINFTSAEDMSNMTVITGPVYVEEYSNISLIHCLRRNTLGNLYAMLVIAESEPEQKFFQVLAPLSWTSLSLTWLPPICCCCHSYEYVDYTYIVILTRDNDITEIVVTHIGNDTVEMELGMEGYECQEFIIEISLPGNCQPAKISGKFLLGKDYFSKLSCTVSCFMGVFCCRPSVPSATWSEDLSPEHYQCSCNMDTS